MDIAGNQILMVTEQAGTLYVLDLGNGSTLRTIRLPGASDGDPGSFGIAVGDGFWWHSDYQRAKLYKLDPIDGGVLAERSMPSTYLGIEWDGSNLWGVAPGGSSSERKLYRIDTATGDILEVIRLPSIAAPIDLTWDGSNLWVSERDGTRFHRIDSSGIILRSVSTPYDGIIGIAAQMPYIWYGPRSRDPDQGAYLLHRYDVVATEPRRIWLPGVLSVRWISPGQ
jgi:hypothetical protein